MTTSLPNSNAKRPMRINRVSDENDMSIKTVCVIAAVMVTLVVSLSFIGKSNQLDSTATLATRAAQDEKNMRIAAKAKMQMAAQNLGY